MIVKMVSNKWLSTSILVLGFMLILNGQNVARSEGPLSHCEMFLGPVQSNYIQFSVNFLKYIPFDGDSTNLKAHYLDNLGKNKITEVIRTGKGIYVLEQIKYNSTFNTLNKVGVNPYSPFKFFINGFNTLDEGGNINGTWMFEAAKSFATRALLDDNEQLLSETNLMFITWGIPDYLTDDLLQMIPAYYKTMASYKFIIQFVAETLENFIDFIEYHHKVDEFWQISEARREFYESFQFFGHSLGSHLISDSIIRVRKQRPELRFGKLIGLDPANPCFLSLEHGLSHVRLNESIKQLVVLHSNAGLAGLAAEKADAEIVLNGGTFQPGCSWLDFACDHARSTDILGYVDDQCQMIAYGCSSYQHFKMGACDTFDSSSASIHADHHDDNNFILVNLNEQHRDPEELLDLLDANQDSRIRQLAKQLDPNRTTKQDTTLLWERKRRRQQQHLERFGPLFSSANGTSKSFNYFVNTNANFRTGLKSHCLQHYQTRLIIQYPSEKIQQDCPISSFFTDNVDSFRLALLYETLDGSRRFIETKDKLGLKGARNQADNVIKDVLYTSLLNFEGRPRLFVGALVNNIDLSKLSKCLGSQQEKSNRELQFVLDVAFMSHTKERVRHTFSSVLCGRWNDNNVNYNASYRGDNNTYLGPGDGLVLELCKESQLSDMSSQIDELLAKMKHQQFSESWKLSLLNSLFSLFVEWEPF